MNRSVSQSVLITTRGGVLVRWGERETRRRVTVACFKTNRLPACSRCSLGREAHSTGTHRTARVLRRMSRGWWRSRMSRFGGLQFQLQASDLASYALFLQAVWFAQRTQKNVLQWCNIRTGYCTGNMAPHHFCFTPLWQLEGLQQNILISSTTAILKKRMSLKLFKGRLWR